MLGLLVDSTRSPLKFGGMHRRHFIRTAGASMGGLLITPIVGSLCSCATDRHSASVSDILAMPDEVVARTENGTFPLAASGRETWSKNAVSVQLKRTGIRLSVHVQCPGESLKSIVLAWKHEARPAAMHLGDAWERAYGDLAWQKPDASRIMPWYVMEYDGESTHGFGVKTGCRTMASWQAGEGKLKLVLDTSCGGRGVRLGKRSLHAADVVARKGKPGESAFQATRAFCKQMCDKPKLPREPMVGTLDWYYTYGKCTDKLFVEEAQLFAKLVDGCGVKAFALVDGGWAPGDRSGWHDDQTRSDPAFGSIQDVAVKVRALGLVPGLWTRTLCTNPKDPESVRLSRDRRILDPSLPENLDRIRNLMRLFRSWGYGVIKHDYSTYDIFGRWGFEMGPGLTPEGWAFKDETQTTAEVILGLYRAIRDGCGGGAAIIGCNTVSHLSAGLFEYCRVGDDSGNNLERAMKFGCNPFAFRLPQHDTFYCADPDCIGNLKDIPWKYNRQFIQLVAESGALLQISTRLGGIDEEHRTALREACKRIGNPKPAAIEPLDWMEKRIPARWRIGGKTVEMDWDLTKK
jgi:alpha-galactosidase